MVEIMSVDSSHAYHVRSDYHNLYEEDNIAIYRDMKIGIVVPAYNEGKLVSVQRALPLCKP